MTTTLFNRRMLMGRLASALSVLGAGGWLAGTAQAKGKDSGVNKMNRDGKPADPNSFITPLITHNGLIYIAGQGANSNGPVGQDDIDSHTTKVMQNVKELVEMGGGTMDSILQLTVYLADLAYYEPMNKIFKTYFPHGGPARTTVAVAALPGKSMLEINCIAAIVRK
ncbi:MAG TPA: RidA family protein [Terriglobales bacterium]|jgi:2-iminobutanoate/2-iminopropanoate deaminase|nr:RidA family protein [Terriglobales bacterium]